MTDNRPHSQQKLIIFFPREQTIAGGHVLFLGWARYIAEKGLRDVYYIYSAIPDMRMVESYHSEAVHYIDWTDTSVDKVALFEGAEVFTPINYIMILLSYMPKGANYKVLTYIGNPLEKKWFEMNLSHQFRKKAGVLEECYRIIDENAALSYMDLSCYLEVNGVLAPENYPSYAPVFYQEPAERRFRKDYVSKDRICVAWLGRLDSDKIESVVNLVHNLYYNSGDYRGIDLHIIGGGNAKSRIRVADYEDRITFHFPSYLYGDELNDYLLANADFAVAMGISALDIARLSIPVVLPIVTHNRITCDKFVYLYDTKDYTLGVTERFIDEAAVPCCSIAQVIRDVYAPNGKSSIGSRCMQFGKDAFSIEQSANCLLAALEVCTLTGSDLLRIPILKKERTKWKLYKKLLPDKTYQDYLHFVRKENKQAEKGLIHQLFYIPAKAAKKVYHKTIGRVIKRMKKAVNLLQYHQVLKHYDKVLPSLKKKLEINGSLRVGFVIILSSTFTYRPIFNSMLKHSKFDPYVIVVPDVSRSEEFREEQFTRAYSELEATYPGRVIKGWDPVSDTHIDIGDTYNILFFANPYGNMVAEEYRIRHFWNKDVLMLYAYYGFGAVNYGRQVMLTDVYNSVWKLLLDTEMSLEDLKIHQPIKGINGLVTGYVKMDELVDIPVVKDRRKRVLVCPHHTVMNWSALDLSNFLSYADNILALATQYPDIDFVFRPHPMLFDNLRKYNLWTEAQIQTYLRTIEALPNMSYSCEGDYMELFVNSDAMIHDCSSFVGEYLFTEQPCCYMFKPGVDKESVYTPLGLACLENYYPANDWDDVIRFMDQVVMGGQDSLADKRIQFVRETLKKNYPHSAEYIISVIEDAIAHS